MKRPAFQFYPGDWLRSTDLRTCSVGARGLWIDMICLMHDGSPYGHLKVGDKDILPDTLARIVGGVLPEIERWLAELEQAGVCSRTPDGTIYSRRMVRDEEIRAKRSAGGEKSLEHPNVPQRKGSPSRVSLRGSLGGSPATASASAIKDLSTSLRSVAPEKVVVPEKQKTTTLATITSPTLPDKPNTDLNREIWEAYRGEYLKTYGAEPVRNAHTNGVIANIGKRLPAAAAPAVAAFYLSVKQPWYVKNRHSLPNLLKDCESLHTQWITGRKVTTLEARSAEHVDNVAEQIKRVGARLENRHETA